MKAFSILYVAKASNFLKLHVLNKDIYVYKSLGALIINIYKSVYTYICICM